jgi:threonine/homoserine/homoserine lactone efflux protein
VVYLVQGFTLGFSAGVSPGPLHAYLCAQAMNGGWRRALAAAFAPLFSDVFIVTLVLLVLTQMPDWVLRALQIVGACFILYLAWGAYKDFRAAGDNTRAAAGTARQSLQKAVVVNLLNPNPYIFWGVVGGPILLEGWEKAARYGVGFIGAFYAALIGTFVVFVTVFATAGTLGPKVTRTLSGLSAVALAGFGLYQLYLGL